MKKIAKSATLAVALVSCATIALPVLSQATVFADQIQYNVASVGDVSKYLSVPNFVSTAKVGETYTIATPQINAITGATTGYTTKVEVYQNGKTTAVKTVSSADATPDYTFTPASAVDHKVVYSLLDSDSKVVATSEFNLKVTGVSTDYTLTAPVNSENIVPATVSSDTATVVTLPATDEIVVTTKDGDVLTSGELTALGLSVVLEAPTVDNSEVTVNWDSATRKVTVDTTKNVDLTYTANYSLKKGDVKVANLKISFVAKKNYTAPTDYTFKYVGSVPTTAEIGVETTLPSISAYTDDNKNTTVEVNYTITITHKNSISGETETYTPNMAGNMVLTEENGVFTFTPNDTGNYTLNYTIKDFYDNAPNTSSTTIAIDDVTQTTQATPKITLPYSGEGNGIDASEAFSEVQEDENIMILPIDADDDANGYVTDNLTLYRQIWDSSKSGDAGLVYDESTEQTIAPTKALIFNANSVTAKTVYVNGQPTTISTDNMAEVNGVTLTAGTTYTVKYFAKNKLSGKDAVVKTVSLKIVDTLTQTEKDATPTVSFGDNNTLPTSANLGESITFKAPTATQTTVDNYSHTTLSTYIKYQLYKDGAWQTAVRYDDANSWITLNEDKTEYTLAVPEDATDVTAVRVIACSTNDLGNEGTVEHEITIIGAGDTQATTIASVTDAQATKVQGQKVTLPTVVYNEDLPDLLNVQIVIDGDEQAYNGVYAVSGTTVTYSGAYFTPENSGDYVISYISTDAGRNKTILTFKINVAFDESTINWDEIFSIPSMTNADSVELGTKVSIPTAKVTLPENCGMTVNKIYFDIAGPGSVDTDNKTYATFNEIGEYQIIYKAEILKTSDLSIVTKTCAVKNYTNIKVVDTTGPELTNEVAIEDNFYDITKNGSLTKDQYKVQLVTADPQMTTDTVQLLIPEASDVDYSKSTLKIVASNITLKTIYLDEAKYTAFNAENYTLSRDDVYQFTYTLVDSNGNTTSTETYTIQVGNVKAPEITVNDGVVGSNYKVGKTVNIDLSKITVTNEVDGDVVNVITKDDNGYYKLTSGYSITITAQGTNDKVELTVNDSSDADIRNNLASYFKFENLSADEYTLKVSVTNSSTKTATNSDITFTVSADSTSPISGEDVLGIVLIVVAVVALGGVVTYFVVTRKKYKNKF